MPKAFSKKYLDENKPKFALLPHDEYMLRLEKAEPIVKVNSFKGGKEEKYIKFVFDIISFRDGAQVTDVDGNYADKRKMFMDRPYDEDNQTGLGFKDGVPSMLRQFIAYITNQDPFEDLNWDWDEIIGKEIAAEIIQYEKKDKEKANKIGRFISPSRPRRRIEVDAGDIPVIDTEEDTRSFQEQLEA